MTTTAEVLSTLGVRKDRAISYGELLDKHMPEYGMTGGTVGGAYDLTYARRLAVLLAQVTHESAYFSRLVENLDYTPQRLMQVFPGRVKTLEQAKEVLKTVIKLGNFLYDGRLGNATGQGYKYRGRGLIQLTGFTNYKLCAGGTGLDIINNPSLLEIPENAVISTLWYWKHNDVSNLMRAYNTGSFDVVSRMINGGSNGLEHRRELWYKACEVLNVKVEGDLK